LIILPGNDHPGSVRGDFIWQNDNYLIIVDLIRYNLIIDPLNAWKGIAHG